MVYTLGEYIKTISVDTDKQFCKNNNSSSCFTVKLTDGSAFTGYINKRSLYIFYCVNANKNCKFEVFDGRNSFLFTIDSQVNASNRSVKGYTREKLLEECKSGNGADNTTELSKKNRQHACCALIQKDGWQIKEDYPWNQEFLEKE